MEFRVSPLQAVIPGAVSLSLDAEGESSPFYADGIVYFRTYANNGYSGDLEIALIPEWFRTEILKELLDSNGVLVEKADNTESVKFALLFEFDGDEHGIRHVLYNCAASRPSIESQTKEETSEPRTETLNLTADPREDGLVKSRTGDTTIPGTIEEWLDEFEMFSIYQVLPEILDLWGANLVTNIESKKNGIPSPGR